jgi:dihydrodipicolinate synthase/N-acetylneuraminate lyase
MPEWVLPSEADLVDFLSRIADEIAPVPLVLYNPPHAKRVLDVALLARLHERVPALIGVKVTDGNASWYATAARELGDVAVFVPGHHLATGMLHGAAGSYSNVACLNPRGAMRWQELIRTDMTGALGLQQRILDFMQVHIQPLAARGHSGIDKLLVAVGGWADLGTRMRWPYHGVPAEHATGLAVIARQELPELFEATLPA